MDQQQIAAYYQYVAQHNQQIQQQQQQQQGVVSDVYVNPAYVHSGYYTINPASLPPEVAAQLSQAQLMQMHTVPSSITVPNNVIADGIRPSSSGSLKGGLHEVKRRRRLTPEETRKLTEVFMHETTKPDASLRQQLADEMGMTPRAIQVWFQNRRAKVKREQELAKKGYNGDMRTPCGQDAANVHPYASMGGYSAWANLNTDTNPSKIEDARLMALLEGDDGEDAMFCNEEGPDDQKSVNAYTSNASCQNDLQTMLVNSSFAQTIANNDQSNFLDIPQFQQFIAEQQDRLADLPVDNETGLPILPSNLEKNDGLESQFSTAYLQFLLNTQFQHHQHLMNIQNQLASGSGMQVTSSVQGEEPMDDSYLDEILNTEHPDFRSSSDDSKSFEKRSRPNSVGHGSSSSIQESTGKDKKDEGSASVSLKSTSMPDYFVPSADFDWSKGSMPSTLFAAGLPLEEIRRLTGMTEEAIKEAFDQCMKSQTKDDDQASAVATPLSASFMDAFSTMYAFDTGVAVTESVLQPGTPLDEGLRSGRSSAIGIIYARHIPFDSS